MGIWSKASFSLRDKIQYLTVLRVLTTTLLLGSAIGFNINNVKHFDHPSYLGLSSIIIATYAFTVVYSWWLKRTPHLVFAAHLGLAFDALAASAQVALTGLLESPFIILFLLVALYGGLVMGRAGGLIGGGYATLGLGLVAATQSKWLHISWLAVWRPDWMGGEVIYRFATLSAASFGAGLLCGLLAERLENAQRDLARSRQSLAALENLNLRILESLASGLITVDLSGLVVYANPAASDLLGLPSDKLLGARLPDLGLSSPAPRWEQPITRASDGEPRTLGLSRTSLRGLDGEAVGEVVTFQDLTELRRAEDALRQRERLATLGRFAAKIAHEIRNPLASISNAAELLSDGVQPEDRTLTQIVQREVDRLNSLLRQVLDFSRPQPVTRQPVALGTLAQEVAALFRLQLKPHIRLSLSIEGDPACLADPQALHQVLWNLWRNAADAADSQPDARIDTRVWAQGDRAWVTISDTGPGIAPQQRAHLFEPFFTTKRGGTGLGLVTIHQIISDLGGDVTLAPWVAGQGACFTVCLPLADTAAPTDAPADAAPPPQPPPPQPPLPSPRAPRPPSPLSSLRVETHAEAP